MDLISRNDEEERISRGWRTGGGALDNSEPGIVDRDLFHFS